MLDRDEPTAVLGERCRVGVVGVKGFVGGFRDHTIPDFGEASLRGLYAETGAEVDALAAGLREIAACPLRIALLHYAPTSETLAGEPTEIWAFLGSERLAAPILEHRPEPRAPRPRPRRAPAGLAPGRAGLQRLDPRHGPGLLAVRADGGAVAVVDAALRRRAASHGFRAVRIQCPELDSNQRPSP